jgi:hypothetical protein
LLRYEPLAQRNFLFTAELNVSRTRSPLMKRLIKREAKRETVGGEWDEGGEEKKANTQQLHP